MKQHIMRRHRGMFARSAAVALIAAGMIGTMAGSTAAWARDHQATDMQLDAELNNLFTQRYRPDPLAGAYDWVQPRSGLHGIEFVSPQRDFQLQGRGLGG